MHGVGRASRIELHRQHQRHGDNLTVRYHHGDGNTHPELDRGINLHGDQHGRSLTTSAACDAVEPVLASAGTAMQEAAFVFADVMAGDATLGEFNDAYAEVAGVLTTARNTFNQVAGQTSDQQVKGKFRDFANALGAPISAANSAAAASTVDQAESRFNAFYEAVYAPTFTNASAAMANACGFE